MKRNKKYLTADGESFSYCFWEAKKQAARRHKTVRLEYDGVFIDVNENTNIREAWSYFNAVKRGCYESEKFRRKTEGTHHFRHAVGFILSLPLRFICAVSDWLYDRLASVKRWAYECDCPF